MPTYVYECGRCGEFEAQQSMTEPAFQHCPTCGGVVRRVITGGIGFIVKGRRSVPDCCDQRMPCCGRDGGCDGSPCED